MIKVYMWPAGNDKQEQLLSVGTIAYHQGHSDGTVRDYRVVLLKDTQFTRVDLTDPAIVRRPPDRAVWRRGEVTGHRPGKRGVWDLLGAGLREVLGKRLRGYGGPRPEAVAAFGRQVMQLCAVEDPKDPAWLSLLRESVDAGASPDQAAQLWREAQRNRAMWNTVTATPVSPEPVHPPSPPAPQTAFLPGVPVTIERVPSPGGGWGTPEPGEAIYDFPGDIELFDAWERLALRLEAMARHVRAQKGLSQNWMPDYPESGVMEAVRAMIRDRDVVLGGLSDAADQLRALCKANADYIKSCRRR